MRWQPPERSAWVSRFNAMAENLAGGAEALVSLDADALRAAARRATGLEDFGDEPYPEALGRFVEAISSEAKLTLLGRLMVRAELQRLLENRLRIEASFRAHPEKAECPVVAPIFVTGLGRSGTTHLHELLWQDPANRAPLLYEMMTPPGAHPAVDPMAAAHREIALMDEIVPAFASMHENAGHLPNECIFIFAHAFVTDLWLGEYQVPSYAIWASTCDRAPLYAWHRRFLQHLSSKASGDAWVLKAPSHLARLPALFAEYPDAQVVVTHRDPLKVLGSLSSLMATLQWMRSDDVDLEACIRAQALGFPFLLDRFVAQRDSGEIDASRVTDVRYDDLVARPIETVRSLYGALGRTLSSTAEERMRAWLDAQKPSSTTRHAYDFASTGLDRDEERSRYARYMARFEVAEEA